MKRNSEKINVGLYVFVIASMILSNFGTFRIAVTQAVTPDPTWPTSWTSPSQCSTDPTNDENPNEADLVGDASNAAIAFASDVNYFYFRERVNGNPQNGNSFKNTGWIVLIQKNGPQYQFLASVDGDHNQVDLYQNTTATENVDFSPLFHDTPETLLWQGAGTPDNDTNDYARVMPAAGGKYFVDWAVPVSGFPSNSGVTANTTKFFATSQDASNYNKDHLDCYEIAADVAITKTASAQTVTVNQGLTYTLTVTNNGPESASNVVVNDTLPAGFSLTSVTPSVGSCSDTTYPTIQCEIGTLANSASATVTIVGTATSVGSLSNTGTASSSTTDENTSNNTSSVTTTVNAPAAFCGDAQVNQSTEQCDDGNTNNADQCNNSCQITYCGDSATQNPNGNNVVEVCDEGSLNGQPNHCNAQCTGTTAPVCGNSAQEQGEQCDDGNQSNTDGCTNSCQLTYCGDATVQSPNGNSQAETCDEGLSNGQPLHCNATCNGITAPVCGNGTEEAGEQCDDGNLNNNDGCTAQCVTEFCGDGTPQSGIGETCDDGPSNGQPNHCNAQCTGTTASICGNSTQEIGETCDDGNTTNGDGCSAQCQSEICGNGTLDANEQCDDSNTTNGDGCSAQCLNEICGDGITQTSLGETCDEASMNGQPNHCNAQCTGTTAPVCGNGAIENGEQCDDDNTTNNDGCSNQCQLEPVTVVATKVVCDTESDLPNWGAGTPNITASTAADFVAQSQGHCRLQSDWNFQWGFGDKVVNDQTVEGVDKLPGDLVGVADGTDTTGMCSIPWCGPNTLTGSGYSQWKSFGSTDSNGVASVEIADLEGASMVWVREVLKSGYVPFTYPPQGPIDDNVTAEIYCNNDVHNFDNYDFIDSPQRGSTYYCVAFNAPIPAPRYTLTVTTNGDGSGFVNDGSDAKINCDSATEEDDCSETYDAGTVVTITATPREGSNFDSSWSGACTGNNPSCQITMSGNQSVNAHFALNVVVPPVVTSSGGGGGGGGGGGIIGLSVFNEHNDTIAIPDATVSWFTNLVATCTASYDSATHDGTGAAPSYGYANVVNAQTSNGTFHTATFAGLAFNTTYFWRPVCTAGGLSAKGQELQIAAQQGPTVLGVQAPAQPEKVKVLGFTQLPDTGGSMAGYYFAVIVFASSSFLGATLARRRTRKKSA